ncbi:hypothetical protein D0Z00_004193 [Geotrichum galactomycetum]|uniref:Uncharacterized protein n=1 Tax=Geotrichum galactomycetum TaxID=27317 RepID=A0ACB6UZ92_9ASCO|nr:hypothetical protein D0Z00_004193 [Geotrichum candidum]
MAYLYKRECVTCPNTELSCPVCASGEQCQMVLQTCESCASYICTKSTSSTSSNAVSSGSSSNAGAIAGGVVGGIAALLLVGMFLIWKYYYKPRKLQQSKDNEKNAEHRLSAETLTSLAPSALARSSNVIPIAYIPGVTTRATIQNSTEQSRVDRSSIATTNYRGSTAVIGSAMMTAIQARPNLVDIKNGEEPAPAAQKIQFARATRQNVHSITIGKSTGLQSQQIPEETTVEKLSGLDEVDEEEDKIVYSQAQIVSTQPKVINLTKPSSPVSVTTPTSIKNQSLLKTSIDNRLSSTMSINTYHTATSGTGQNDQKSRNSNGDASYLGGTLADLDGRISPFDDHYKV